MTDTPAPPYRHALHSDTRHIPPVAWPIYYIPARTPLVWRLQQNKYKRGRAGPGYGACFGQFPSTAIACLLMTGPARECNGHGQILVLNTNMFNWYQIWVFFICVYPRKCFSALEWRLKSYSKPLNPLEPSGYYTYHQFSHQISLHSAHRVCFVRFVWNSEQQRLFPQTALTGWFL